MCWTQLSSIIMIGTSIVTACATWKIMKFNANQTKIADQKRKDDLFKIRWEFYQDIIKFIRNINFHLDELIYSNPLEKNKEILWNSSLYNVQEVCAEHNLKLDQDQIDKKALEVYECNLKKLDIYHDLEVMLALYDTTQGNIPFYVDEAYLEARFFIKKSKYLFGNDVSEFLEQFLSIDKIREIYKKYYLNIMQRNGLDNIDILKKTIEIYGWSFTEDTLIRGSRNSTSSIDKVNNTTLQFFKEENKDPLENLNKVLFFLKAKSFLFRTTAGLLENSGFEELERKFDEYLKLK
jgi:hypothetical protein